jgi:uncharacterized protein YodC (DUF2158 family)
MKFNVVKLKSGGPDMTVSEVSPLRDDQIWCQWFGGRKLETGRFPLASLIPGETDDKAKK